METSHNRLEADLACHRRHHTAPVTKQDAGNFSVLRGKPKNSEAIAQLISHLSKGRQKMSGEDVMAGFGDKAYMLLQLQDQTVGIAGWQVENLVARTTELYMENGIDLQTGLETLMAKVEQASHDLQCEASLIFPDAELAKLEHGLEKTRLRTAYSRHIGSSSLAGCGHRIDAAGKQDLLLFKQLRQACVPDPFRVTRFQAVHSLRRHPGAGRVQSTRRSFPQT